LGTVVNYSLRIRTKGVPALARLRAVTAWRLGELMQFVAIYLYVMAVGFVTAGLLASFVQLVSGQPMRFGIEPDSILASLGGVMLRVLAGPAILMRNAWRGLKLQARPKIWFGVSAAIAAVWSLFSGALLLDLILQL
jgi:Family of unknown function (DUF6949)